MWMTTRAILGKRTPGGVCAGETETETDEPVSYVEFSFFSLY